MRSFQILLFILLSITFSSCDKTYEEGPKFSLRSKMNRITGKWKLVSMEGVERLNPEVDQYLIITNERVWDNVYTAEFENFQDDYYIYSTQDTGQYLFSCEGYWQFYSESFWKSCAPYENFEENEAIMLELKPGLDTLGTFDIWKIKQLKFKELIIENIECPSEGEYYQNARRLTFEKIENL
ncbi:MAG: hypothetical protein H6582_08825 [Crocinitomicaceae bacterium]|nr:hypothetical protein [Crocinitomicaceae bacterium]